MDNPPATLSANGIQTYTVIEGKGPPLVMLHGWAATADCFALNVEGLHKRYRVIVPDLPGHGRSERGWWPYNLGFYLHWLEGLQESLGLDSFHLAGNSMGGAISLAYAHRHPKRVKSLILIDPLGVGGSIPWDTAARFLRNAWSGLKLLVNGQKRRDLLDYAEGMGILSSPDSKSENALMEMVAANAAGNLWWMMAGVRFVLADFLTPGKRGAFAHAAGEIERPTLLVWGRKDGLLPVRFADALLSRLPEAYLRIFEHSGHMPMLDEPERFNRLVDDFIKGKLAKKP